METNELKQVANQWHQMALVEKDPQKKQDYLMNYLTVVEQMRKNQENVIDVLGITAEVGIAVIGVTVGLWYDRKGLYISQEATKGVIGFAKNVFGRFFKRH